MLAGAAGQMLRAWNGRGFVFRCSYDELRRPTHRYVLPAAGAERLAQRIVYGEDHPQAAALNLRGRPYQAYDGAGVVTSVAYDFKGNLLESSRRLRSDVHADADWSALAALADVADVAAAAEPLLDAESFVSQTAYDALNRPTSMTTPDASELRPTYNDAGLLERVEARLRGGAAWTTFVDDIDYDAHGRRERIDYGNGTTTVYSYDPLTFRLTRLKTTRTADGAVLQNLAYAYDPVGNITEIGDSAQQTVFFNNAVVSLATRYAYDAVYRLIEATGREHAGGIADVQRDQNDLPIQTLPHPNDAQALRSYTEQYIYDAVGNLLQMIHQAGAGSWTRRYAYEATSNRLLSTSLPGDPVSGPYSATYAHDAHGNMTSMPHIAAMTWDEDDQVRTTNLGGGGAVYYVYDAAGQRVRKVWEHSGLIEERIYLGGYEVYRKRDATGLLLERQTLHVMDDTQRVATVETKTVDAWGPFAVTPRLRYQLGNHLGSASLEVDGAGLVIGYEEYHPYGTTAYWSASSAAEVSRKRYRYTGKEKDEETGLYYHGARYYAPWLGRWTNADPAGMIDGPCLFGYARENPVRLRDPNGRQGDEPNYGLEALQYISAVNSAQLGFVPATPEEVNAQQADAAAAAKQAAAPRREQGPSEATLRKIIAQAVSEPAALRSSVSERSGIYTPPPSPIEVKEPGFNEETKPKPIEHVSYDAKGHGWSEQIFNDIPGYSVSTKEPETEKAVALGNLVLMVGPGAVESAAGIGESGVIGSAEAASVETGAARAGPTLTAAGDTMGTYASRATPVPGYTDVVIHGSETAFYQTRTGPALSHRVVARMLAADAGYAGGPIRLIACKSGASGATAAQNLANKLGVEVLAPTDTVWVFPSGRLVVGPAPTTPTGTWTSFFPGVR
jgi:RHS repeat-associated protein